jgi:hypothetical protein
MATATQNPGTYDPETEGEQSHPDLGPGHDGPAGNASDPRGDRPAGDASDPRGPGPDSLGSGALRDAENGGGDNPQGGASSRPHLRDVPAKAAADRAAAQRAADRAGDSDDSDDKVGKGYNRGKPKDDKKGKSKGKLRITKKQALIGGGAGAIISLVMGFFGAISSGPAEFVHIAQLLTKLGFSSQQDAEDGRLMKIARYINQPNLPQNTRLGFVGTHVANKLDARIKDASGVSPRFDRVGTFQYYLVDRNNDKFKGKSFDQVKAQIASDYGIDGSAVHTVLGPSGLEYRFNPDPGGFNVFKRYVSQTRTARALLGESGLSKVSSYAGGRVLTQRAGWTFHPIKQLDAAIRAALLRGGLKALDALKSQFSSDQAAYIEGGPTTPAGGDPSAKDGTDAHGNPAPPDPTSTQNKDSVAAIKALAQGEDPSKPQTVEDASSHIKAKIAAGGTTLIGVICVLDSINHQVNTERQAKVVLPMMKIAGQYIELGSQVQSGQDLTTTQLGFFKDQLDDTAKDGSVISTWNQSQPIEAELGEPQQTANDLPKQAQVFTGGGPFDFLNDIPAVGTACSILGSGIGQVFSIVTGPINYIISGEVIGDVADFMSSWLSGAPVVPKPGQTMGSYMAYGTRASGNEQYAAAGGVPMSTTDEQTLKTTTASLDNADFQSKSIAYRLFNTGDSQTLASHIIDNYGSAGPVQAVATMVRSFGNIFASALRAPASLLSSVVHAAPAPYDYHGMKKVGFTAEELGNHTYDNPFDNACRVAGGGCKLANGHTITTGILDGPNGKTYIDRAQKCFDVNITGDSTSGWVTDSNTTAVNFLDTTYQDADCKDSAQDWLRVRFWLLDTSTVEGYDCYQGDSTTADQSCTDVGFPSQTGAAAAPSTPGILPTGSAKDLATQLEPFLGNKIQCNSSGPFSEGKNCSDIENTANGVSIKGGEGCQADALDPTLLGMLLEIVAMNHTFVLSALCSDHHDDGQGGHAGGKAADFNYIDGVYMGQDEDQNGTIPWTTQGSVGQQKIAVDTKLLQDVTSFMPKSTGFGQIQCHDTYSFLSSFPDTFPDGCHHQHIQVGT